MRKFSVSRRLAAATARSKSALDLFERAAAELEEAATEAAVAGEEARQRVVHFEGLRSEANRQASHNLKRAAKIKEFIGE